MKSDLELWLESESSHIALRAARKINYAARAAHTIAGLVHLSEVLSSEEQQAYEDMLTLMDRLAKH